MAQLKYKTRGNSSPQGKPRVYFCCHHEDFRYFFESITDEIQNIQDCAIWYEDDFGSERDELFYNDLKQMQLFVMPITTKLLTTKNRALDEDFAFAIENHIPVLPLMQESGLDELFNQKCGDLQFLSKNSNDATEISYEEKLKKYLSSMLISNEMIKKIQAAFDAYIFLSYRKKDRLFAQQLMRLIHKNDFCRDIAIWYDEFLTPGENFNDSIKEALDKSKLFVLAVTPSLLEPRIDENGVAHKNYIEEHEYPMATKAKKPILPAELVETNKILLSEKYKNIPDCVDANDDNILSDALLEKLKKLAIKGNDNSPEHNFFIGLAYLDGVDVEVDHEKAFTLISFAAEHKVLEAVDQLIQMYNTGHGVKRDYFKAIEWMERKIDLLEEAFNSNPNGENTNNCFWAIIKCGDAYDAVGNLAKAKEKYLLAKAFCKDSADTINTKRNLATSYNRIGNIYKAEDNITKAKEYYEKAAAIAEILAKETNTVALRRDLSVCYGELGYIYYAEGNIPKAKEYYEKTFAICEILAEETNAVESRRDLSSGYNSLGNIYYVEGNIPKAKEYYEKALIIDEILAKETNNVKSRRSLSIRYINLGNIYEAEGNIPKAKEYYEKLLSIAVILAEETNTVESRNDLSVSYNKLGNIYYVEGNITKAKEYCEKAFAIREILAIETNTVQSRKALAASYNNLGNIHKAEGNITKAKEYYEKALAIREILAKETNTVQSRRDLSTSYSKLGNIYKDEGNITKAKEYHEKALAIDDILAKETKTPQSWHDLALSYSKLSLLSQGFKKRKYLNKALKILNMLCETCPEVANYRKHRDIMQNLLNSL